MGGALLRGLRLRADTGDRLRGRHAVVHGRRQTAGYLPLGVLLGRLILQHQAQKSASI